MRFFINLVIEIGLRNELAFLREMARLEYAVSIFCFKLQTLARKQAHHNLAEFLGAHGNQELKHGKMLGSFVSIVSGEKITQDTITGRWVEMSCQGNDLLIKPRQSYNEGLKTMVWDSKKFPGEKITAKHENFDGISRRYLSLRLLFGGKKAQEFDWSDKLAFMHVLEKGTSAFYEVLSHHPKASKGLRAIALEIYEDECEHADYLQTTLGHFTSLPNQYIDKWQYRVRFASIGLLFDIWRIIPKRSQSTVD